MINGGDTPSSDPSEVGFSVTLDVVVAEMFVMGHAFQFSKSGATADAACPEDDDECSRAKPEESYPKNGSFSAIEPSTWSHGGTLFVLVDISA
jgi:hypothetical protein